MHKDCAGLSALYTQDHVMNQTSPKCKSGRFGEKLALNPIRDGWTWGRGDGQVSGLLNSAVSGRIRAKLSPPVTCRIPFPAILVSQGFPILQKKVFDIRTLNDMAVNHVEDLQLVSM